MSLQVTGELFKKYETEAKTESFSAREFVLLIQDGNYPQHVKFQLVQDRCPLLDPHQEGDEITVHFDLRGREWQGKYFTNLNAWRLEAVNPASPAPAPATQPAPEPEPVEAQGGEGEADDDLPF